MSGHKTEEKYRQCHVTWGTHAHTNTHKTPSGDIYWVNVQVIIDTEKVHVIHVSAMTMNILHVCVESVFCVLERFRLTSVAANNPVALKVLTNYSHRNIESR